LQNGTYQKKIKKKSLILLKEFQKKKEGEIVFPSWEIKVWMKGINDNKKDENEKTYIEN